MTLPRGDEALVNIAKLKDYCLCRDHPVGKHKARVFEAALDFTSADAETLREWLLTAAATSEAIEGGTDGYGTRYVIDFEASSGAGACWIRSAWILPADSSPPRLVTCYVIQDG
jgi:hypothetical protein